MLQIGKKCWAVIDHNGIIQTNSGGFPWIFTGPLKMSKPENIKNLTNVECVLIKVTELESMQKELAELRKDR